MLVVIFCNNYCKYQTETLMIISILYLVWKWDSYVNNVKVHYIVTTLLPYLVLKLAKSW